MIPYTSYKLIIEKKAQKLIEELCVSERTKVVLKIKDLVSTDPKPLRIKKLQGYKNLYRLRVDDYRVMFVVLPAKKSIIIVAIGHRKEVYDIVKRMRF
jgi:mRNA interferase RelE/StbE